MGKRIGAAIEGAFVLFFTSAAMAAAVLASRHSLQLPQLLLACSVPSLASLALALVASFSARLMPGPRLDYPASIALPLVHSAFILIIVRLAVLPANPLEALAPQLKPAAMWAAWPLLIGNFAIGAADLEIVALVARRLAWK